jgi:hypothetical protein
MLKYFIKTTKTPDDDTANDDDNGLSGGIPNFKTLVSMWILKKNFRP